MLCNTTLVVNVVMCVKLLVLVKNVNHNWLYINVYTISVITFVISKINFMFYLFFKPHF